MAIPKIGLGIALLIMMLMLYVGADFFYGAYSRMVKDVMLVYFMLFVMVMAATGSRMPLLTADIYHIRNFVIGFVVTAMPMLLFLFIIPSAVLGSLSFEGSLEGVKLAVSFGLFHGFIKAYIEEAVFRDILYTRLGRIPSSVLFGMFHVAIISISLMALGKPITVVTLGIPVAILSVLGYVWTHVRDRLGLMGSVGSHWAYNLGVMKILPSMLGVG